MIERPISNKSCPIDEILQAFNEGRVDVDLMDLIVNHLEHCQVCLDRLEVMSPGPLAHGLRQAAELPEEESESSANSDDQSKEVKKAGTKLSWENVTPSRHQSLGFERYELIGTIGSGDFANVYLAINDKKEPFAVKIPFVEKLSSPDHIQQFLNDSTLAYSLRFANILSLSDFGFWQENVPFVATPHVSMPNLRKFAKTSCLPNESSLGVVFSQICFAVDYAHQQRVLHRHLHPNNIFIDAEMNVLVADFCLNIDGRYHFELLEPLIDPTPFVSPEAINNDPAYIDHRNDIFALGKILKLLLRITSNLDESRRESWESIQAKCTRPRRRDRFQSIQQLVDAVRQFQPQSRS